MNETYTLEAFRGKFRVTELRVIDTGAWTWSVRPYQPTLGAGIDSPNRLRPVCPMLRREKWRNWPSSSRAGPRSFAGSQWMDNGWPALPVLEDSQHKDDPDVLGAIQEALIASDAAG